MQLASSLIHVVAGGLLQDRRKMNQHSLWLVLEGHTESVYSALS